MGCFASKSSAEPTSTPLAPVPVHSEPVVVSEEKKKDTGVPAVVEKNEKDPMKEGLAVASGLFKKYAGGEKKEKSTAVTIEGEEKKEKDKNPLKGGLTAGAAVGVAGGLFKQYKKSKKEKGKKGGHAGGHGGAHEGGAEGEEVGQEEEESSSSSSEEEEEDGGGDE